MRKVTGLLATAATAMAFVGCTALPTAKDCNLEWLAEFASPDAEGATTQIVAIWTDASLKKAGENQTRGFGGRIYLYDAKRQPVKAHGELIIYAFVEHDRQAPSKLPDRKFVFTAEELEEHYSRTAMGHSYAVWLPWDQEADGMVTVSLLPTFKPGDEKQKVVVGAQSLNILKGKEQEEAQLDKMEITSTSGVRPVSYITEESDGQAKDEEAKTDGTSKRRVSIYDPQTNVVTGPLPKPASDVRGVGFDSDLPMAAGVSTTTIDLPPSMSLALKNAPRVPSRREALAESASEAKAVEPANGTVFDLGRAAALAEASAKAKAVADEALAAGVQPAAERFPGRKDQPPAEEGDAKINRFNSRKREPPSWNRNREQRW